METTLALSRRDLRSAVLQHTIPDALAEALLALERARMQAEDATGQALRQASEDADEILSLINENEGLHREMDLLETRFALATRCINRLERELAESECEILGLKAQKQALLSSHLSKQ